MTAPLLAPGYLLLRDAVSTPRSYLSDAALGLTQAAPRALPQDFAVAVLSAAVDGGIVVKILLIAGLFLAGWGAASLAVELLPDAGLPGQLIAVTLAIWNPYVGERLLQGHWSLLVGYGCLPWVALAVIRLRTNPAVPSGVPWIAWASVVFWIALAGLTPTGLMLAATVALVCVAVPGEGIGRVRCGATVVVLATAAALPWLMASALSGALDTSDVPGLAAFSARAEPGLGTLGSLAGLGGIWNAEAVPASRTTLLALAGTLVLLVIVAIGLVTAIQLPGARPLLILAAVSVLLPAAMATGPGLAVLRSVVDAAPGLGVLRDGQKWVALAMLGYSLAGAAVVLTARRWMRPAVVALVCVVALIAVLPDLVWGVAGKVESVHYPLSWAVVAGMVNADPGTVAVLPPDSMRQFTWSGPAPVLDPLPRWVRPDVLTTGDLVIAGETVAGEGSGARAVQKLLLEGSPAESLADSGVSWVVVEADSGGDIGAAGQTLKELPIEYRDADLTLYRVNGADSIAVQGHRLAMVLTHLVWLAMIVASAAALGLAQLARLRGLRRQGL